MQCTQLLQAKIQKYQNEKTNLKPDQAEVLTSILAILKQYLWSSIKNSKFVKEQPSSNDSNEEVKSPSKDKLTQKKNSKQIPPAIDGDNEEPEKKPSKK